jgi:hypothetical protein
VRSLSQDRRREIRRSCRARADEPLRPSADATSADECPRFCSSPAACRPVDLGVAWTLADLRRPLALGGDGVGAENRERLAMVVPVVFLMLPVTVLFSGWISIISLAQ